MAENINASLGQKSVDSEEFGDASSPRYCLVIQRASRECHLLAFAYVVILEDGGISGRGEDVNCEDEIGAV